MYIYLNNILTKATYSFFKGNFNGQWLRTKNWMLAIVSDSFFNIGHLNWMWEVDEACFLMSCSFLHWGEYHPNMLKIFSVSNHLSKKLGEIFMQQTTLSPTAGPAISLCCLQDPIQKSPPQWSLPGLRQSQSCYLWISIWFCPVHLFLNNKPRPRAQIVLNTHLIRILVKMAGYIKAGFTSFHDCIKVTTKL